MLCNVPDHEGAAGELARVLRPGGALLLFEPAFPMLRRAHDKTVHTLRRYRRASLTALAEGAGLTVRRVDVRVLVPRTPRRRARARRPRAPAAARVRRLRRREAGSLDRRLRAARRRPSGAWILRGTRPVRHVSGRRRDVARSDAQASGCSLLVLRCARRGRLRLRRNTTSRNQSPTRSRRVASDARAGGRTATGRAAAGSGGPEPPRSARRSPAACGRARRRSHRSSARA